MSTSLLNCEVLLSKQLGDYWSGTATSDGSTTTIVDTALNAKADNWISASSAEMYDMLTLLEGDASEEERKIVSLSSGTLTVLAHTAETDIGDTYRIHRLWSASDKRIALVSAAKDAYPHIFKEIRDETKVLGNWLRNGSFEEWDSDDYPDYWRVSGVTATKNTTAPYYYHGAASCTLDSDDGYMYTNNTLVPDFGELAGKTVTFKVKKAWCDTASCLRLAIYDGTTTTYSSYHDGDSAVKKTSDEMYVQATIADEPTSIEFRVYLDVATGTAYVDDARLISGIRNKYYIGDLGLARNRPHGVYRELSDYSQDEPWKPLRGTNVDKDGWLYIPTNVKDYRLRIEGIGYLDFYDTDGDVGTDWDDTIAIDSPQTEILVAQAAVYLWRTRVMPGWASTDVKKAERALAYWERELLIRKAKFGMKPPPATVNFGVSM